MEVLILKTMRNNVTLRNIELYYLCWNW